MIVPREILTNLYEVYNNWARELYEPWLFTLMHNNKVKNFIMINEYYSRLTRPQLRGNMSIRITAEPTDQDITIHQTLQVLNSFCRGVNKKNDFTSEVLHEVVQALDKLSTLRTWSSTDTSRLDVVRLFVANLQDQAD